MVNVVGDDAGLESRLYLEGVVMRALILAGMASVFVIGLVGCGDGGQQSSSYSTPAAPKEVVKITAAQLFAAYDDNEVATDEGFKGKIVQVSGTVQSIDKDAFDNIVINFKTSNQFMPAHMKMDDSEKAAAIAMKKGVKASVQCQKMARMVGSPYGSGCRFVADEPIKKKTTG